LKPPTFRLLAALWVATSTYRKSSAIQKIAVFGGACHSDASPPMHADLFNVCSEREKSDLENGYAGGSGVSSPPAYVVEAKMSASTPTEGSSDHMSR